jgi:hypothetical protein
MIRTDALPTRPRVRAERSVSSSLSVLIEVPEVKASGPSRGRRRVMDRQHDWRPSSRSPRRRLRREVRVASGALLLFVPLICVCALGWQSLSSQLLATTIVDATARPRIERVAYQDRTHRAWPVNSPAAEPTEVPSAVVLSIEPAVVAPESGSEIPVILPGYVLPDDSLEESSHAGS